MELKKRGDAEVKYLDKVRECEALQAGLRTALFPLWQENLNEKEEENLDLKDRLYEERREERLFLSRPGAGIQC